MASTIDLPTWPTARNDAFEVRWTQMGTKWLTNGVFLGQGAGFVVTGTGTNGMTVYVGTGEAWLGGEMTENTSAATLDIAAANASLPRRDLIVIRLDKTSPYTARLRVLTGTPASSPVDPVVVSTTDIVLARVTVGPGVTSIGPSSVTDLRSYASTRQVGPFDMTLGSGFTNDSASTYGNARYYRDGAGTVRLEGRVNKGSTNNSLFTLPAGYRPQFRIDFPLIMASGPASIGTGVVNPTGLIEVFNSSSSNTVYSLASIQFRAYF